MSNLRQEIDLCPKIKLLSVAAEEATISNDGKVKWTRLYQFNAGGEK